MIGMDIAMLLFVYLLHLAVDAPWTFWIGVVAFLASLPLALYLTRNLA